MGASKPEESLPEHVDRLGQASGPSDSGFGLFVDHVHGGDSHIGGRRAQGISVATGIRLSVPLVWCSSP